nr:MAG TPA: hypothetical protein [Caudoviricetes sp.]
MHVIRISPLVNLSLLNPILKVRIIMLMNGLI